MTSRSSATYIAYDLRPAKQAERRMLLDYFESMKESGLPISSYRYLGMGGIKFYDFSMVHRFLGISDLVSCERSEKTFKRSVYNRPFSLIDVRLSGVGHYISSEISGKKTLCWLDYDDSLSSDIIDDIRVAGTNIPVGSALFVTIAIGMPRSYVELSEEERFEALSLEFGIYCADVTKEEMEEAKFPSAYVKILRTAFKNAFSSRKDGTFLQNFSVEYSDSTKMMTIGGCFIARENEKPLKEALKRRLGFVIKCKSHPYKIRNYNMTERERHLFEFSASARRNCAEARKLKNLGFSKMELETYRDLVRFMPRYVEALL